MLRRTTLILSLATVLFVPVAIELAHAAGSDDVIAPQVPSDLQPPAGQLPFLIGHASGTQNYSCLPSGAGYAWTLFGPQATLFDGGDEQIVTHFLSANPAENGALRATWQHSRDTSTVWAFATGISTDANYVAPGAIPWLLLHVSGAQYGPALGDKLARAKSIQRVNTAGGVPPATGCSASTDVGRKALVPYTADYIFYKN